MISGAYATGKQCIFKTEYVIQWWTIDAYPEKVKGPVFKIQ